ncbi:hypothetical protein NPIL_154201 [Nephila pilipes]|uniref:Uncharacterized protein n=1 Tax=Nephila pilipes TaxID=299642 RepID=A0A8X6JG21_NEPPI|nr:hypothetical protein NPIL_154201 [Nephila pilipes]
MVSAERIRQKFQDTAGCNIITMTARCERTLVFYRRAAAYKTNTTSSILIPAYNGVNVDNATTLINGSFVTMNQDILSVNPVVESE